MKIIQTILRKATIVVFCWLATLHGIQVNAQIYSNANPSNPNTLPGSVQATLLRTISAGDQTAGPANNGQGLHTPDNTDQLNCDRVYIYDLNDLNFTSFRMMIFDMGTPKQGVRLYPAIDHWNGSTSAFYNGCCGKSADFVTQDVMEYSVWGSNDAPSMLTNMANWTLLSDVTAFDNSAATVTSLGHPTFSFAGQAGAPDFIYTSGSNECGTIYNGYTRDYNFCNSYRYIGVRSSTITMMLQDGDPEIDAVFGYDPVTNCTVLDPVPTVSQWGLILLGLAILSIGGIVLWRVNQRRLKTA